MDFLRELANETTELRKSGRLRQLRQIEPLGNGLCRFNGKTFHNFSSNDYLGIAADPELRKRFYAQYPNPATPELALSSASSRLLTGNTPAYGRLEEKLSRLYGGRAALVFNSGYHANIGILPALARSGDLVLSDKLNHASIIDGLRLCDAEFKRYPHLDYERLEKILREKRHLYKRVFIVTESIFSMDGDEADLRRFAGLKRQYDCILIVDEAHSVGVRGPAGAGLAAEQNVCGDIDILIGTFGKAFGSTGAYAVMEPEVKQYLIDHMRSLIFTTGLPPAVLNWSCFTLDRAAEMDAERAKLRCMGEKMRAVFGEKTVPGVSQIIPFLIGADQSALDKAAEFQERGILVFAIRPPTVPPNTARLRFSLTAALGEDTLDSLEELL